MALTSYEPVQTFSLSPPFQIKKAVGEKIPENSYYVESGVCFSSFSFDTGSFVPIRGLGTGVPLYTLENNKKLYIDMTISRNLQISGAEVKCTEVGTSDYWQNYPNMIEIKPQDVVDANGRVTKIVDNKVQTKCYILIGYNRNDTQKNRVSAESPEPDPASPSSPVQILDTNFIMLASVVSGVAVVFPSPYFNGLTHLKSVAQTK